MSLADMYGNTASGALRALQDRFGGLSPAMVNAVQRMYGRSQPEEPGSWRVGPSEGSLAPRPGLSGLQEIMRRQSQARMRDAAMPGAREQYVRGVGRNDPSLGNFTRQDMATPGGGYWDRHRQALEAEMFEDSIRPGPQVPSGWFTASRPPRMPSMFDENTMGY